MSSFKIFVLLFFVFCNLFLFATEKQMPTKSNNLINDYVGVLDDNEKLQLEQKLSSFNDSTKFHIVVLIVDDLLGYEPKVFADIIGETWCVGNGEFDDGIVVLIKPTGSTGQRKSCIVVGYELQSIISDVTALKIVNKEMMPLVKNGRISKAINKGVDVLVALSVGTYTSQYYNKKAKKSKWLKLMPFILLVSIFVFYKTLRRRSYSLGKRVSLWTKLWLMTYKKNTSSGTWSDFSSGSSGFGGFGGGTFGGGAGGSW